MGRTGNPAFPSRAFYYRVGLSPVEIGLNGGRLGANSWPELSTDGRSVTGSTFGGSPFVWSPGGGLRILAPALPLWLYSISADGGAICGTYDAGPTSNDHRAFHWDTSGGLRVFDVLTAGSSAGSNAISRDGTTTVGGGGQCVGALWREDGSIGQSYCGPSIPNSAGFSARMILTGTTTISQGALCLSGSIGRFVGQGQVQAANIFGEIALSVDPSSLPGPHGFFSAQPGQSLYFQAWYRDLNQTSTSNYSSGATVRFY